MGDEKVEFIETIRKTVSKFNRWKFAWFEKVWKFKTKVSLFIFSLCVRFISDFKCSSAPLVGLLVIPIAQFHALIIKTAFLLKSLYRKVHLTFCSFNCIIEPNFWSGRICLLVQSDLIGISTYQIDWSYAAWLKIRPECNTSNFDDLALWRFVGFSGIWDVLRLGGNGMIDESQSLFFWADFVSRMVLGVVLILKCLWRLVGFYFYGGGLKFSFAVVLFLLVQIHIVTTIGKTITILKCR